MTAVIHAFPTVTHALDSVAAGLERTLHNRYPHWADHLRVVVQLAPGGAQITLRTLGLNDMEIMMAQEFLNDLTATVTSAADHTRDHAIRPGMRHMRRPAQPRVFEEQAHTQPRYGTVVHLAQVRRAS